MFPENLGDASAISLMNTSVKKYRRDVDFALKDNLEQSGVWGHIFLSGKSCFSKSQGDLFMLLGFWDNLLLTFTGIMLRV